MSIKNIVFDFGQVLVHYEPEYMTGVYVTSEADKALLQKVVFDRLYWDRLDAGTIDDGEVISECKKRLPEHLWDVAEKIYYNWIYNIPEVEGMRELIIYLKDNYDVKLYLLSNISKYFAEHKGEISILSLLDNCVFSGPLGIVKPNKEIFEYLCNTYSLIPGECIFVDDNTANINSANSFGINAYLFDGDVERLKKYLEEALKQ
ncbi:MAG: HAD family phosphatase [Clostridia bacterium]|nr:HAD family phosphatase [Clostridia bacterium]